MARNLPTLPAAVPDGGTPRPLRVRHPVRAEEELELAMAAGHLAGWRCLRRFTHAIAHDPNLLVRVDPPGGTSPDGDTWQHIVGPWERGPFATHVAVTVHAEVAAEGASLAPEVALTLQWYDGAEWVDLDAPDGEGGGPGVVVDEDGLDRSGEVELLALRADTPDVLPSSYPTGPRALVISDDVEAGDRLRLVVDAESARVWLVVVRELRAVTA